MGFDSRSVIRTLKYYLRFIKSHGKQKEATTANEREHRNLHRNSPNRNSCQTREPEKKSVQISALVLLSLLVLRSLLVYCWIVGNAIKTNVSRFGRHCSSFEFERTNEHTLTLALTHTQQCNLPLRTIRLL